MSDVSPLSGQTRHRADIAEWPSATPSVFGGIHATCLSALVTDRAVKAWYDPLHGMNDPQPEGHMASHIGRRKFLATLAGAAAWPLAARAQQAERVRRIGLLMGVADDREGQARVTALKQGLQELGWTRRPPLAKMRPGAWPIGFWPNPKERGGWG
jgi:hypothetical protein